MQKLIVSALYFILEIFYYFGSSFVVISQQITRFSGAILTIATNLFWLTLYGTPALVIITITSLIFITRWISKFIAAQFSTTNVQRTAALSASK